MKRVICFLFIFTCMGYFCGISPAAEHGGKEHGGHEHDGVKVSEPSAEQIRAAMSEYVAKESKKTGTLDVYDKEAGKTRKLSLIKVHERVGKTGNYYYSCADFKDTESQEMLDLDLDVESKDGNLSVVDVRVHKVGGKERYTYDAKDNRIPVAGGSK
ncbi:MAG: hypothetical protein A2Y00_04245 [Omnitrophica WOR_2 bacterium GWF2_43_52]|nr:MAG: hypothetical protein A2Y01_02820 [Omnitrophica WOR_2 bacterium GWC2_44_8]OGX22635.1 MAG: hypothetical protein A2Y00_04245 [Omnitrophica WOR_2 bacterium GWF2_43_52]OGX57840.1 MAG: hypothetical protein A2460_07195 [Omnitrophica WOR_2 bacterium RIFOXYC2_FULL_43_9]HAH21719.1 hypothetical protein [Candidatus Omnitrophota bacterium]HBG64734.1 hypothetical protein [Candidatus Omnitrophota bacterium]